MVQHECPDSRRLGQCAYCTARAQAALMGTLDEFDLLFEAAYYPTISFHTNKES